MISTARLCKPSNLQGENGAEWLEALKRFNRKENPWPVTDLPFPKNDLGHYQLNVMCYGAEEVTGAREITLLLEELRPYGSVNEYARTALCGTGPHSYEEQRLRPGQVYTVALVPSTWLSQQLALCNGGGW